MTASCRRRSRRSATPRPPRCKIIVAINKIDLPGANIDKVKGQLQEKGSSPEDWGGDVICARSPRLKGTGIDTSSR